jgi:alpha-amylase
LEFFTNPFRLERNVEVSEPLQIDGWVGFDFAGRGESYSSMKYRWQHFSGVDWDDMSKQQAIYKISAPGKGWASDVSTELGNYDYLMFSNLDHSHPEVRQDLLNWGTWITDELSLSGMRLDAAKHISAGFQKEFVAHVQQTANPEFFVIGEYWTGNLSELLDYLNKLGHTVAAYDVPLLDKFSRLSHQRAADLRGIFENTLVQCRPDHAVVSKLPPKSRPVLIYEDDRVKPRYGEYTTSLLLNFSLVWQY